MKNCYSVYIYFELEILNCLLTKISGSIFELQLIKESIWLNCLNTSVAMLLQSATKCLSVVESVDTVSRY